MRTPASKPRPARKPRPLNHAVLERLSCSLARRALSFGALLGAPVVITSAAPCPSCGELVPFCIVIDAATNSTQLEGFADCGCGCEAVH